ncbi:hypothetical protein CGCVW01_v014009 [Colletotrichum viniferum]|nr:hypothetical protein CGCVW01_v014009 [Colletotrichum viniferum]
MCNAGLPLCRQDFLIPRRPDKTSAAEPTISKDTYRDAKIHRGHLLRGSRFRRRLSRLPCHSKLPPANRLAPAVPHRQTPPKKFVHASQQHLDDPA